MKNKIIFYYIALALILITAFVLRIYLIGQVPASPDWDEAALGYNAYSILLAGKDEYGKFLPVVLQSFDDYKPALYTYLIIPFIKILGLSVVAVRLPAIISGVIAVLLAFLVVRNLFEKGFHLVGKKLSSNVLALTVAFFTAISPWHIQFSRVGFEAGVGLTCNLAVIYFFLKSLKNQYFLILTAVFAALNIYIYQSEKVYTPLLLLILISIYFKRLIKFKKRILLISFFTGILIIAPMLLFIVQNPNALSRAKGVSVFTDTTKLLSSNKEKIERDVKSSNRIGAIIDNRRIEYFKTFASGYLSHFEPNWLFYRGDVARHHAPFMGNLYLFTLPFILIGLYMLVFMDIDRKVKIFIILYLLLAPIPASVTIDVPHAVRSINTIPSYEIFTSIGILSCIFFLQKQKRYIYIPIYLIVFLAITLNIFYYLNQYFVQLNYFDSEYWQYGWKEAVAYTTQKAQKFDHVVVTNQPPLDQSYIFFLFYLQYDPIKYLSEGGTKAGGFNQSHTAFGKYEFREIKWDKDKFEKNTVFLGRPGDLPDNIGKTIYYLNGEPAIVFSDRYE